MQHMMQAMNYEIVTNLERLSCTHSWPQYSGLHTILNHWDTFELNFCPQNICLMNHTCRNSLCQDYYAHTALNGDKNNTEYAAIIIIYQLVVVITDVINKNRIDLMQQNPRDTAPLKRSSREIVFVVCPLRIDFKSLLSTLF